METVEGSVKVIVGTYESTNEIEVRILNSEGETILSFEQLSGTLSACAILEDIQAAIDDRIVRGAILAKKGGVQ